jgi:hypothetical protein
MFSTKRTYPNGTTFFQERVGDNYCCDLIPGSDTAVVSFGSSEYFTPHNNIEKALPWGFNYLHSRGFTVVGIKCAVSDYYRGKDFHAFMKRLRDDAFFAQFRQTIFYGGSMGGYGALAFSSVAQKPIVIAHNPQTTACPSLTPWEIPFRKGFDWTGDFVDGAAEAMGAERIYASYDPYYRPDRMHLDRIKHERLVRLRVPFVKHGMPMHLYNLGLLVDIFEQACSGTLTESGFDEMIEGLGEKAAQYMYHRSLLDSHEITGHQPEATSAAEQKRVEAWTRFNQNQCLDENRAAPRSNVSRGDNAPHAAPSLPSELSQDAWALQWEYTKSVSDKLRTAQSAVASLRENGAMDRRIIEQLYGLCLNGSHGPSATPNNIGQWDDIWEQIFCRFAVAGHEALKDFSRLYLGHTDGGPLSRWLDSAEGSTPVDRLQGHQRVLVFRSAPMAVCDDLIAQLDRVDLERQLCMPAQEDFPLPPKWRVATRLEINAGPFTAKDLLVRHASKRLAAHYDLAVIPTNGMRSGYHEFIDAAKRLDFKTICLYPSANIMVPDDDKRLVLI